MKKIIFFDFDGTLYPFRPYDSENLLFCMAAETEEEKVFAEKIRLADEQNLLPLEEIRNGELKLITGKSFEYVDKTTRYISDKAGKDFLKPLKKLKNAGYDLYIVSCGLSDLADSYLEKQEVRNLFTGIYSKNLIVENGLMTGIDCSRISKSEDKGKVVREILSRIKEEKFSISVGDGLTDIPMFEVTDKALFIDLGDNPFTAVNETLKQDYPITHSIEEMVNYILNISYKEP